MQTLKPYKGILKPAVLGYIVPAIFAARLALHMPARQKKLTAFAASAHPQRPCQPIRQSQRRLEDLKKVVSIKGGAHNFDVSELDTAKDVLRNENSTTVELLNCLRRLSCLHVTRKMLLNVDIGSTLRHAAR